MEDSSIAINTEAFHETLLALLEELSITGRLSLDKDSNFMGPCQVRQVALKFQVQGVSEAEEAVLLAKIKTIPGFFAFGSVFLDVPGLWVFYRVPWPPHDPITERISTRRALARAERRRR